MNARRPPIPHTLTEVAQYWWAQPDRPLHQASLFPYIGMGEPFCFRCGWLTPATRPGKSDPWAPWGQAVGYLERAHLADYAGLRTNGRLDEDVIGNLVPMCVWCHVQMPDFDESDDAIQWVLRGARCPTARQLASDIIGPTYPKGRHWQRVDRLLARMYEGGDPRWHGSNEAAS